MTATLCSRATLLRLCNPGDNLSFEMFGEQHKLHIDGLAIISGNSRS